MRFIVQPFSWFVALLVLMPVQALLFRSGLSGGNDGSSEFVGIALAYAGACWVGRDGSRRRNHFPPDLVFFASILMFPIYLISTRRWRGLVLLGGLLSAIVASQWLTYLFSNARIGAE